MERQLMESQPMESQPQNPYNFHQCVCPVSQSVYMG